MWINQSDSLEDGCIRIQRLINTLGEKAFKKLSQPQKTIIALLAFHTKSKLILDKYNTGHIVNAGDTGIFNHGKQLLNALLRKNLIVPVRNKKEDKVQRALGLIDPEKEKYILHPRLLHK